MNTNRPSDANPPKVIQFFGFESADRAVTLFGRSQNKTYPAPEDKRGKHIGRLRNSKKNKRGIMGRTEANGDFSPK